MHIYAVVVGCSQWGFAASTMTSQHLSDLAIAPIFLKIYPHLYGHKSVRVHPYAHPQHLKVLKHFVYIQYGCGMQSMGVCSLNHDLTSYRLSHTHIPSNSPPLAQCINGIRMHPYAHPQHLKVLKHCAYIQFWMWDEVSQWGFSASTMTPQNHTCSAIPHFP
jgi:hypothetical protein